MTRAADIAVHIVLRYGIDLLDQAYGDLSADQRKLPHIQEAMAALDALSDAVEAGLARAIHSKTNRPSVLDTGRLEWPLARLVATWSKTADDQRHDALTDGWKARCARDRRRALAWKTRRAAK
jgi:hypothetical protein